MITLNNYTKSEVGNKDRKDIDQYYGQMILAATLRDAEALGSYIEPILECVNGSNPELSLMLSCMPAALESGKTRSEVVISTLMNLREKHDELDLIIAAIIR